MDLSRRFDRLTVAAEGGEGTLMLLREREKPGWKIFGYQLNNSYWALTLLTVRGRAVPLMPLLSYLAYTVIVCTINAYVELGKIQEPLNQLTGVTNTVGVALFFLLSFRNNAAFNRWQNGTEKFKNFCASAKLATRNVTNNIAAFVDIGGAEGYDALLECIKWISAAVEVGRQHLRSDKSVIGLHDILTDDEVRELHTKHDPVLYCMYKAMDVDRKYVVGRACEWSKGLDIMYMEFSACVNVFTTPIPLAYIAHLRVFLVMWLACIAWVYVPHYGWFTILLCGLIGYGIIGIEEAAVEVEQPYGKDFNDVPIDWIVADTLKTCCLYVTNIRKMQLEYGLKLARKEADAPDRERGGGGEAESAAGGAHAGDAAAPERVRDKAAAFERTRR